jgi:hypothetical protein
LVILTNGGLPVDAERVQSDVERECPRHLDLNVKIGALVPHPVASQVTWWPCVHACTRDAPRRMSASAFLMKKNIKTFVGGEIAWCAAMAVSKGVSDISTSGVPRRSLSEERRRRRSI